MGKACFYLTVLMAIVIHTLDMVLTEHFIGNHWWQETFLPMRECIKAIGIYNALWVSRVCFYLYLWLTIHFMDRKLVRTTLLVITILYWTAMVPWLFTLGYINWS